MNRPGWRGFVDWSQTSFDSGAPKGDLQLTGRVNYARAASAKLIAASRARCEEHSKQMAATPVSAASCHIVEHLHQGRIVRPRTIGEITEMNSRGFPFASGFGRQQCFAKSNHSKERRAPLSKQRKVIDKPTQRLVNLRECADHDHQSAERTSAAEICGRRDDDRSDN